MMRGAAGALALLALAGCAMMGGGAGQEYRTVALRDAAGRTVGTALLRPGKNGVDVTLSVNGLPPGTHGVHFHETGRCDAPDFASAGGHFNPNQKQHGAQNPAGPHAGDLPNLTVDANQQGFLSGTAAGAALSGSNAASLRRPRGTALVIHATADDLRTDPSGNSGARIACGVVTPED
ncbi:MAG TPA: superoxide dismutase family protein [Longimicrobium sp.]|jgi:Cu-Zn family superoxide dismutase|uniref:superoxide dismutase family protein n=1 Tax=Longimicrobium sp. TaxID=2029185 RepID=UPI002ED8B6E7